MAHIIVDKDNRCTCSQADSCALMHKSGSMPRCTSDEIEAVGHVPVSIKERTRTVFSRTPLYEIKTAKPIHNL